MWKKIGEKRYKSQTIWTGNSLCTDLLGLNRLKCIHQGPFFRTNSNPGAPACASWTIFFSISDVMFKLKFYRSSGVQKGRGNEEGCQLSQIYQSLFITEYLRVQRLLWKGHVQRMNESDCVPKKCLLGVIHIWRHDALYDFWEVS
jgi:hypothetical protein